MKKNIFGFTIIEILIGIVLLAIVTSGILGLLIVVQRYFKNGFAMASSQATARLIIEKIVRPDLREGMNFAVSNGGNTLTITESDSSVNVFTFNNGDGSDATYSDNTIKKNGNVIGTNIVRIPGKDVFQELEANELAEINFGVKNEGLTGHYREVHICTEIKLRN